jgi:hypothetical protein
LPGEHSFPGSVARRIISLVPRQSPEPPRVRFQADLQRRPNRLHPGKQSNSRHGQLSNGKSLTRLFSDGRLPMDNNGEERDPRRVAVRARTGSWSVVARAARALPQSSRCWPAFAGSTWACRATCVASWSSRPKTGRIGKAPSPLQVRTFRKEERDRRAEDRRYRAAKRRIEVTPS